jgi:hypothetical protein
MYRFIVQANEKKKRNAALLSWSLVVCSIVFMVIIILIPERDFSRVVTIIINLNLLWMGVSRLREKNKIYSIEVTEAGIEWLLHPIQKKPLFASWSSIHWIKLEHNNSITLYYQSSFSKSLKMGEFSEENRKEIFQTIQEFAMQKQIRLINFSEPVLALA